MAYGDQLSSLFFKQEQFEKQLGYDFDTMTHKELADYVKEHTLHTEHEMHEMLQELPYFKGWKKYPADNTLDQLLMMDKAQKEYVDALHFFIAVGIALGFTAETVYEAYTSKMDVNHCRQQDTQNYKKCVGTDNGTEGNSSKG